MQKLSWGGVNLLQIFRTGKKAEKAALQAWKPLLALKGVDVHFLAVLQTFQRYSTPEALTSEAKSGKTKHLMSNWNIKTSTLIILSCVVFLMLLIVILPDVDLPDTAFHRGTAPVVVHARATMAPTAVTVIALFQMPHSFHNSGGWNQLELPVTSTDPNFRPILLRSIRR